MIGNDIISIQMIREQPRANNAAYLAKVLTRNEFNTLENTIDKELVLWKMWALKESAYKLEYKINKIRRFAPKTIECKVDQPESRWSLASIHTASSTYWGKVWHNKYVIHALVASSKAELTAIKFGTTFLHADQPADQSFLVRKELREMVSNNLGLNKEDLSIHKEEGIPIVSLKDKVLKLDISLSHHGHWGAISFLQFEDN